MTVSIADTAELPRVRSAVLPPVAVDLAPAIPEWIEIGAAPLPEIAEPAAAPDLTVVSDVPAPPRALLRVERQRERRQRMWWTIAGLSALVAMLAVTVAVLSMVR